MTIAFHPHHAWLHDRRDGDAWSVARLVGCRADGLCMVAGVTTEGARVMSVLELAVGDEIILDMGGDSPRPARVRWIEGAVAGIGFVVPTGTGTGTGAGPDRQDHRRQPPRFRRCVPVTLERHGREQAGELVEVSQFGARIAAPPQPWLRVGGGVVLEIDGCDALDAEVRWRDDGHVGLAFRSPVQLRRFDKQLQQWATACVGCRRDDCEQQARTGQGTGQAGGDGRG